MKKLLIFLPFIAFSCAKKGCIDVKADNYYSKAKKDDGSCTYSSDVIFWQNAASADSFANDGYETFSFYINGQLQGTCAANTYFTGVPLCGETGIFHYKYSLGKNKTTSITYRVDDELGVETFSGTISLTGGSCFTEQLQY